MVAVVRRLSGFERKFMNETKDNFLHHNENRAAENLFRKNVRSLLDVMNGHGNPFDEGSSDMYSLVSKRVFRPESVNSIRKLMAVGTKQLNEFMSERLIARTTPFYSVIFPLLNFVPKTAQSKKNDKIKILRNYQKLFSQLFSQNRPVDLADLFKYENQYSPPSLSCNGIMRHGTKSVVLNCIEPTDRYAADEKKI